MNDSNRKIKILDEKFHNILNMMNRIEKIPRNFGTSVVLYPSEIHTIVAIGNNPGISVTELAKKQGVTKGAVSQIIRKLETKSLIIKMKELDNDRKICLKLSKEGETAYQGHDDFHAAIHYPLVDLIENASEHETDFVIKFLAAVEEFCSKVLES